MSQIQIAETTQNNHSLSSKQVYISLSHQTLSENSPNSQPSKTSKQNKNMLDVEKNLTSPLTYPQSNTSQAQTDQDRTDLENLLLDKISASTIDFEANGSFQIINKNKKKCQTRENSFRSLQSLIDDIKKVDNTGMSNSASKASKSSNNIFKIPIKWPKRLSEIPKLNDKSTDKQRKRPLSNNDKLNKSRSREENCQIDKKVIKTAVKDLELSN